MRATIVSLLPTAYCCFCCHPNLIHALLTWVTTMNLVEKFKTCPTPRPTRNSNVTSLMFCRGCRSLLSRLGLLIPNESLFLFYFFQCFNLCYSGDHHFRTADRVCLTFVCWTNLSVAKWNFFIFKHFGPTFHATRSISRLIFRSTVVVV